MIWQQMFDSLWDIKEQGAPQHVCALAPELKSFLISSKDSHLAQFLVGNAEEPLPDHNILNFCSRMDAITSEKKIFKRKIEEQKRKFKKQKEKDLKAVLKEIECETNKAMKLLAESVCARFGPRMKDSLGYLRAFRGVIDRGNEKGIFDLCPPWTPFLLNYEESPYTDENMALLDAVDLWRDIVKETALIENLPGTEERLGRIFASAILNGGLLCRKLLKSLFRGLPGEVQVVGGAAFFDLDRGDPEQKTFKETRRWFIDPLSEIFILRLTASDFEWVNKELSKKPSKNLPVWQCLKKYFAFCIKDPDDRPKTFSALLKGAIFDLRLSLPPFLVHYATGRHQSHSLKKKAFLRIHGHHLPNGDSETDADSKKSVQRVHSRELPDYEGACLQSQWYVTLKGHLQGGDHGAAVAAVKKMLGGKIGNQGTPEDTVSAAEVFTNWAYYLLMGGVGRKKSLPLKVVRAHIKNTGSRLLGIVGSDDVTKMDSMSLLDIYTQVLEDAESPGIRHKFSQELRQFHGFLKEVYAMDVADFKSLITIGLSPVDANIITEDEYVKILNSESIKKLEAKHKRLGEAARLLVILGFRCGTRRGEAIGLTLDDFHLVRPAELYIVPNENRGLKTPNAERAYPFQALLSKWELGLFIDWEGARRKEEKQSPNSNCFFAIPDLGYSLIPEFVVFSAIREAFEEVTGDPSIRYHHLRHSFATWTLMKLMMAGRDLQKLPIGWSLQTDSELKETHRSLLSADEFKLNLFGHNDPTRKNLFAVSSLLGHSGPPMSLEHYIHCCDMLLAYHLREAFPIERKILSQASGVKSTTVHNWFDAGGKREKFCQSFRQYIKGQGGNLSFYLKEELQKTAEEKDETPIAIQEIRVLHDFLYSLATNQGSLQKLAERFDLSVEKATAYSIAAQKLADMKVENRGKESFLHDMSEDVETGTRLACPRWPKEEEKSVLFRKMAVRLWPILLEKSLAKESAIKAIHHYINRTWKTSKLLHFLSIEEDGEAAVNYLNFLKNIGLVYDDLYFVNYSPIGSRPSFRSEWKKHLKLRKSVRIHPPEKEETYKGKTRKRLGIGVKAPKEDRKKIYTELQSSKAFHFLLKMGFILITKPAGNAIHNY